MGEFFKGWRRKAGCVILLVTFLFMVGWIRSLFWVDIVDLEKCCWLGVLQTKVRLVSGSQLFALHGYDDTSWKMITIPDGRRFEVSNRFFDWSSREGCNLQIMSNSKNMHPLVIQYWMPVLPLTLISAYLLLSKQRVAKPKKSVEPIPADRA